MASLYLLSISNTDFLRTSSEPVEDRHMADTRVPLSSNPDRPIRVAIAGYTGRMGQVVMNGLPKQPGIDVVGGLSRSDGPAAWDILDRVDVLLDFTHKDAAPALQLRAIEAGVRPICGTTGLSEEALDAIDKKARQHGIGALWAPHFALVGVLMTHFARVAARYLDSAEIVEIHHVTKADAPSGAARVIANAMVEARGSEMVDNAVRTETMAGVRGAVEGGVRVHSVRLSSAFGIHEVMFGGDDEMLTLRWDILGLGSYVPAVARAVRAIVKPDMVGLIRGYDNLLGLNDH
jgi:4-hydroxy-tetrahydrodipicolinate reductase